MHGQLSLVEGQLFDGVCIEFDPLSNNNLVMSSDELEFGRLASTVENSNSNTLDHLDLYWHTTGIPSNRSTGVVG